VSHRSLQETIVLASTSPARRALLEAAAIPFLAEPPEVDERVPASLHPKQVARLLAAKKARSVALRHPRQLVVGADQTVELAGALLRKPGSRAEARRQIAAMAGRSHFLHTAIAVRRLEPRFSYSATASVRLTMLPLSRRAIEAYLDTDEWRGCAGGYRVEGQGIKLLESIRGDYHAVVGLPMLQLLAGLRRAGVALLGEEPLMPHLSAAASSGPGRTSPRCRRAGCAAPD
jgi:septum formation protein